MKAHSLASAKLDSNSPQKWRESQFRAKSRPCTHPALNSKEMPLSSMMHWRSFRTRSRASRSSHRAMALLQLNLDHHVGIKIDVCLDPLQRSCPVSIHVTTQGNALQRAPQRDVVFILCAGFAKAGVGIDPGSRTLP